MASVGASSEAGDQGRGSRALTIAAAVALAAGAGGLAFAVERGDAFWLDESWTGAIIAQPSWRAAFQQIYWDVNAPLYYVLIRAWSLVFGLSDWALRAPSLICAMAIPLVAALWPTPGLTRGARLCWAAVLAFWFPTLCFAAEARCYALLLLVCTGQAIAYARLMRRPSTARASAWAALSALAILVHYDALYIGAAQGLLYLAGRPRRALASWPAALLFAPAFGWLLIHSPRIAQFARPDIAWYSPLRVSQLPSIGDYLANGGSIMPRWLLALGISALSLRLLPLPAAKGPRPDARPVLWTAAAAIAATALVIGVGFVKPSFTFRYLTPCAPGLMMGLVWLASCLAGRRAAPVALVMLALVYPGVSGWMLTHHLRMAPRRYNFEAASTALGRSRPARLVFLLDHPVDPVLNPTTLQALGGFFLHRQGLTTSVDAVVLRPGEDPSARLEAEAVQPGTEVLWIYDRVVRGTAAITHPPRRLVTDPTLRCRSYGSVRFGVLACVRL